VLRALGPSVTPPPPPPPPHPHTHPHTAVPCRATTLPRRPLLLAAQASRRQTARAVVRCQPALFRLPWRASALLQGRHGWPGCIGGGAHLLGGPRRQPGACDERLPAQVGCAGHAAHAPAHAQPCLCPPEHCHWPASQATPPPPTTTTTHIHTSHPQNWCATRTLAPGPPKPPWCWPCWKSGRGRRPRRRRGGAPRSPRSAWRRRWTRCWTA
jgi:hypothetical protein